MGDTWITDLTHFTEALDPTLDVPASAATAMSMVPGDLRFPPLPCRRRPDRKPCPGYLFLEMPPEPPAITWGCVMCGDNGIITNFQGTPWDLTPPEGTGQSGRPIRVMIPEDDFRALRDLTLFDRDAERAVKGAELAPDDEGVCLTAPREILEELAGELASYLNERPKRARWAALDRVSDHIEAALRDGEKIVQLFRKASHPDGGRR